MNIQVGAGGVQLPGFLNVDVRRIEGVDIVGDAGALPSIGDGLVRTIFGNAIFEHFFVGHHLATLCEWKRMLTADGAIIIVGLPDFAKVAELYLQRAPGIVGDRFDLMNVYRYTHGEPEHAMRPAAGQWQPDIRLVPSGWIPQLHKCIFDVSYVRDLMEECGLAGAIFRYAYPGEAHALNLGFIAMHQAMPDPSVAGIRAMLERVPEMSRFADLDTIALAAPDKPQDGLLPFARELGVHRPARGPRQIVRRFLARLLGWTY
jgi:hypothetical protein